MILHKSKANRTTSPTTPSATQLRVVHSLHPFNLHRAPPSHRGVGAVRTRQHPPPPRPCHHQSSTYNRHSMDYCGVRARVLRALGFRALLDFSGVIAEAHITVWHVVRRPPSPSLPPSRPRCPSLPPSVRIHKQHIRLAPFASGQRCKPVSSSTCSSYRAREAAPPRLPRRPTTMATTLPCSPSSPVHPRVRRRRWRWR
ncbi:hypothetical protein B0H13DRAFT_222343 [Mycena leptocephala]|nr:hypothetical protein B0H13DRAFT_222343 [Mycena leptocephala]